MIYSDFPYNLWVLSIRATFVDLSQKKLQHVIGHSGRPPMRQRQRQRPRDTVGLTLPGTSSWSLKMVGFQGRKSPNFQGVKHFQGRNGCSFQGGFFWVPTDVRHLWIDDDFPNFPFGGIYSWRVIESQELELVRDLTFLRFLKCKNCFFPSRSDPTTHLGDYIRCLFLSTYVFPSLRLFVKFDPLLSWWNQPSDAAELCWSFQTPHHTALPFIFVPI